MFRPCLVLAACVVVTAPGWAAPAGAGEPVTLPAGDSGDVRGRLTGWGGPSAPGAGGTLAVPVAATRLSSVFGMRADPLRGGIRHHQGIDLPGVAGTPVRAAADGVVDMSRAAGGYGNLVELDHGGGLRTRYAHLLAMEVEPGTSVRQGDIIGLMGSTGRSTGSHLHFEVRLEGRPTDPLARLERAPRPAAPPAPVVTHWAGWQAVADRLPAPQLR